MKYATAILFTLALLFAGCGGGYQAPPKGNERVVTNSPGPAGAQPTGPDMSAEYEKAAKAAFAARDAFKNDKTAENFAKWGANIYAALTASIKQDRHGRSTSGFYRFKELREMKTDFTKTFGPNGWEDNPEYKAAKKAYDEVQE